MPRYIAILVLLLVSIPFGGSAHGAVYNLHLVTDNGPDYTDLPSLVASATGNRENPQDKCIAIWRWGRRARHQMSCVTEGGRQWPSAGTIRHDDLWNPPGDYEPWEHDDRGSQTRRVAFGVPDPACASLPAGGRPAYSFPLVFARPLSRRYVRFVCTPLDGKGMGISEIQVFEQVEVSPWPAEIWLPNPPLQ